MNILKLVVSNSSQIHDEIPKEDGSQSARSSIYVQSRSSIASLLTVAPKLPWGSSLTLAESSWSVTAPSFRKELPGRTLQFTYDIAATPLIGAKLDRGSKEMLNEGRSDDTAGASSTTVSCWRRPHGSQVFVVIIFTPCSHSAFLTKKSKLNLKDVFLNLFK